MKGSVSAASNLGLQVYKFNEWMYKIVKRCSFSTTTATPISWFLSNFLAKTRRGILSKMFIFWNKNTLTYRHNVFPSFLPTTQLASQSQRRFWSRQTEALWASRSDEQTVPRRMGDREPQAVAFVRSWSWDITIISVHNVQYYRVLQIFLAPIDWIT